jgi:hypothetical protein
MLTYHANGVPDDEAAGAPGVVFASLEEPALALVELGDHTRQQ